MTNQEWGSAMKDLRQTQLASQPLIALNIKAFERRLEEADKRWEATDKSWNERFDRLTAIVESHGSQTAELRSGMLELRAAMVSLASTLDTFIKGRTNGH